MVRVNLPLVAVLVGLTAFPGASRAYGEQTADGFPSWYERIIQVYVNRARADPPVDLASCGSCADAPCFPGALPPMEWDLQLNRAARFHAANLTLSGCGLSHSSPCTVVGNIDALYPASCDGDPSCACSGAVTCGGGDNFSTRLGKFGVGGGIAENAAWLGDPLSVFYAWFHEPTSDPTCAWSLENGHRWNILGSYEKIGVGGSGGYTIQDFQAGSLGQKIPAGAHYPETGASIEFRANWYDTAGPNQALVNIDGTCYPMSLERGTVTNGTYLYSGSGLGAGCHEYYFFFLDSADNPVYYPDTGSFGFGCGAEWSTNRPAAGPSCNCAPDCTGLDCGDDGCGGSCGNCGLNADCNAGTCQCRNVQCQNICCAPSYLCNAADDCCIPDCAGRQCGDDGCDGFCGSCTGSQVCNAQGQCVDPGSDAGVIPDAAPGGDAAPGTDASATDGTVIDPDAGDQPPDVEGGCRCDNSGGSAPTPFLVLFLWFYLRIRSTN